MNPGVPERDVLLTGPGGAGSGNGTPPRPGMNGSSKACAGPAETLRQCPTPVAGEGRLLIAHQIEVPLCFQRQREFYHRCHRCLFRGKGADFLAEPTLEIQHPVRKVVPAEPRRQGAMLTPARARAHANGTEEPRPLDVTRD